MKNLLKLLLLSLALLITGCESLDSSSIIYQNNKNEKDEITSFDIELNDNYKNINFTVYKYQNKKWDVSYNRDWELDSKSINLQLTTNKKGIVLLLNGKNISQTETICSFTKNFDDNFENKYDIINNIEITPNVPFALIACLRDYKNNSNKKAKLQDLQNPKSISLDYHDEYYILVTTIKY